MLFLVIAIGVFGFEMIEEEFTFLDSFYMTIITVSTVGFQEVHSLSDAGRIFTAFLIVSSFGIFAYSISSITTFIMSGNYRKYFIENKMLKHIHHLSDHVIVCGYGRVGQKAVQELLDHNKEVIVIEQDEEIIEADKDKVGVFFIHGDSTEDSNLKKAGIERAKAIITTLPSDADNLYVVLSARELCSEVTIISRSSNTNNEKKLKIAGADNVIMPDVVGGSHMASLVITPDINEFLDHISVQGAADVNLEEVAFSDFPEDMQYATLRDLDARNKIGVNIIGFKTADGEYIINPGPNTTLLPDSKLFVLGTKRQISVLNKVLNIRTKK
jgi:voltage-gated potassium channel